ncbi:MAG: glycosyltransferase [Xenococcaceae cyanobacterium]
MSKAGQSASNFSLGVTIFGIADIELKIKHSGLNFWLIGESEFPLGWLEPQYERLGKMSGREGRQFTIELILKETTMLLKRLPTAIQSAGVEALIVDQVSTAGGTVADKLEIPYVTICNALLINQEAGVPPYFTHWDYNPAWWAKLRNRLGYWFLNRLTLPIWQEIQLQRQQWQLPLNRNRGTADSKLAQICQLPKEFDFPRVNLPPYFHYTGSLQNPSGIESISFPVSFPWEKLNDKPLIYASLGTLQNKVSEVFQCIAEATTILDVQLVISLGNPNNQPADYNLPDNVIVVSFAPHQKLIERASLVITHAGMNTTLGALSSGVPIVAIPITNEQPGIAARIARTGAGKVLPLKDLKASRLQTVIKQVLTENSYQENAQRLQKAIARAGGVKKAADIVEQVVTTKKPVIAGD